MGLLRKYQQWHCDKAIKLYTLVGKALASEYVYCAAHTLKDARAHSAIRELVLSPENKILPTCQKDIEAAAERYAEYMDKWMSVWNEHSLTYQAWNAEPDTGDDVDEEPVWFGPEGATSFTFQEA